MLSLQTELHAFYTARRQQIPTDIRQVMDRAGHELAESGQATRALPAGATAPDFALPTATGGSVRLGDLQRVNGGHPRTLPLPATYVIAPDGLITWSFVNTDYTRRAEPADILTALTALRRPTSPR